MKVRIAAFKGNEKNAIRGETLSRGSPEEVELTFLTFKNVWRFTKPKIEKKKINKSRVIRLRTAIRR
jgi:hypothetical protein